MSRHGVFWGAVLFPRSFWCLYILFFFEWNYSFSSNNNTYCYLIQPKKNFSPLYCRPLLYNYVLYLFKPWIYEQVRKTEGPRRVNSKMKMGAVSTSPTSTDKLLEVVHHSMRSTFRVKRIVPHHHQCLVSISIVEGAQLYSNVIEAEICSLLFKARQSET